MTLIKYKATICILDWYSNLTSLYFYYYYDFIIKDFFWTGIQILFIKSQHGHRFVSKHLRVCYKLVRVQFLRWYKWVQYTCVYKQIA